MNPIKICLTVFLAAFAGALSAQTTLECNLSATLLTQGASIDTNNITTVRPPKVSSFATADLLKQIAIAEFAEGNWSSNTFPAGSRLVYLSDFEVNDRAGNVLIDVSDVLYFSDLNNDPLTYSNSGGSATTNVQLLSLTFNPSGEGAQDQFTAFGLGVIAFNDSSVDHKGNYLQSTRIRLSAGVGQGLNAAGQPIVFTNFVFSAFGTQSLNNGEGDLGGFQLNHAHKETTAGK